MLDRTGNTSSASIPLALADALDDGRVADGDLVLLIGFGAGMTAASAVLRWGGVEGVTRSVLVTGGARGIGLAVARRFAALGDASPSRTAARRRPTASSP